MICIQCSLNAKYKCPTCRQPYCSVGCYKLHKENPCSAPTLVTELKNNVVHNAVEYEYPTEDTVPIEKLLLLEKSAEVKKCLENPYLREVLELLDKSSHPDALIKEYMIEPIFTEFADACLKVVQPRSDCE
ncbi:Zinc finger HIT domain-containing protein 3 [Papilio machaon]|uniref:Zinc finger HIT domain-containing protein 3 n=1 Tax=Papilio machaon TaxID=76193 RepID=A0A194QTA3_PAPMA|nr:Zinc finger HIT domain-containing protein 3 [Papilio machaon]